jgi:hypothetical protein
MPKIKSEEEAAKRAIVDWVYRWWLRGGGTLLDKDFNARNIGLARGAEDACANLYEVRKRNRELRCK